MSEAFEILSAAIDEAIEDAKSKNPKLERHEVTAEFEENILKVNSDLYETLMVAAKNSGKNLNEFVEKILYDYLSKTA